MKPSKKVRRGESLEKDETKRQKKLPVETKSESSSLEEIDSDGEVEGLNGHATDGATSDVMDAEETGSGAETEASDEEQQESNGIQAKSGTDAKPIALKSGPPVLGKNFHSTVEEEEDEVIWRMLQLQATDLAAAHRSEHKKLRKDIEHIVSKTWEMLSTAKPHQVSKKRCARYISDMGISKMGKITFAPPMYLRPHSHFTLGLWSKPRQPVDVLMGIPEASVPKSNHRKDFANHAYHAKRLMYLMEVRNMMVETMEGVESVHLLPYCEDLRRPVLEAKFSRGKAASARIRIIPTIAKDTFPLDSLSPDQSNLPRTSEAKNPPPLSPLYDMSVMEDMLMHATDDAAASAFDRHQSENVVECLHLLKTWLNARGLLSCDDGFTSQTWVMLVLQLLNEGFLNAHARSLRLFRSILAFLSGSKLSQGLHVLPESTPRPNPSFHQHFQVSIIDPTGRLNMAWNVGSTWIHELKIAAKASLKLLDETKNLEQDFAALFPTVEAPRMALYDYLVRITCDMPAENLLVNDATPSRKLCKMIEKAAKKALTDRVKLMRVFPSQPTALDVDQGVSSLQPNQFMLCVSVDPDNAWRLADRGPSAEDKKASKGYRAFWGERSEMTRFPDSVICEAVSWNVNPWEAHTLPDRILAHVLHRHLPGFPTIDCFSSHLDACIDSHNKKWNLSHKLINAALENLKKCVTSLQSLALPIKSILPVGSIVRQTAVHAPAQHPLGRKKKHEMDKLGEGVPRCLDPIDVLVELETSGGWPQNPMAYKKTKAALGIQLAVELQKQHNTARATEDYVDVIRGGFAFRLHLFSTKDEVQARQGMLSLVTDENKLHGFLGAVGATHPSFNMATRFAKRWIGAQMLSSHISPQVVELLMTYVYTEKGHHSPPASPLAGFVRFLSLVAQYPFLHRPLFIDPKGEFSVQDYKDISKWYTASKKTEAGGEALMNMCLSTPLDRHSNLTRGKPTPALIHRLGAVAKRTVDLVEGIARETECRKTLNHMFHVQVDFDALVHFRSGALPHPQDGIKQPKVAACRKRQIEKIENSEEIDVDRLARKPDTSLCVSQLGRRREGVGGVAADEVLVGFDPVRMYVDRLEAKFGHLAVFCYDEYGGKALGIRWRPNAFAERLVNPATCVASVPTSKKVKGKGVVVKPDVKAVLREVWDMGRGLVEEMHPVS
ncbi:hypothetical protein BSKO_05582 [Bryopsis sp. KO-2023]|nr:hypothetical protein BSKO_05582 [Bryopsis sp. KO-2023]